MYSNRKLADGYPDLDRVSDEWFSKWIAAKPDDMARIKKVLRLIGRLIDLDKMRNMLLIGCGPRPQQIKILTDEGFNVLGIEPQKLYVKSAQEYLGDSSRVKIGSAEDIPVGNNSQHIVFMESVLEHVDSPLKSLDEIYRVLLPGGITIIGTTNRHRFSLTGKNGEYNKKFFNWFPNLVKESYVFHHLHYKPILANYTPRPAVHWFSYSDLCKLGRMAGFAQFYSFIDLLNKDDPSIARSKFRSFMINKIKYNPWLRALVLSQIGGAIIMLKRK